MSEKAIVVEGAMCKCQFGNAPDKIKVLSHKKEFANNGKLIVTTMEVGGSTLEKNTFGSCNIQRNKPCQAVISQWQDFYDKVTLSNGGNIILETCKAVCPIAGSPCIEIIDHGQIEEPCRQNIDNADEEIHAQLNPLVNLEDMKYPQFKHPGIEKLHR